METTIVYFDGVCNFCSGFVNFLIKADRHNQLKFAALQSAPGQKFCQDHQLPTDHFDTFYLYENGAVYNRSTAALKLFRKLGWPYSWLYVFIVLPVPIRDNLFYKPIAKNRYKWFGKTDACMIPTPEIRAKFLA
jgi:predicted DCC family thiol-disulfide oxidoreductase YuxK